jgi:HEXXH motif-containing protein
MGHFEPSRAKGEGLRSAMDAALWRSVRDLPHIAAQRDNNPRRATPMDYGAYADLVLNIPAWQTVPDTVREEARRHLNQRLSIPAVPSQDPAPLPLIRNFATDDYSALQLDRISRWMTTEEANDLGLAAASDADVARIGDNVRRALAYLEKADPELFGEILALVDEIIVTTPGSRQRFEYTAGTSFGVWGAIVVNSMLVLDWTEAYDMLAHEAGHLLLFAIARDEPLVLNASDAIYASPVRDDPRPMDGIFHAAFVASREARAFDRLLAWHGQTGGLTPTDEKLAEESL